MFKAQQPKQILPLFKQKVPDKLGTKNPQNIQHIKHQRQGTNIEHKPKIITSKTPSTKPTLIQTKHYHNNLNKTFSKIIKKKQSNI